MSKMREALRDFIQEWERRSGHPDPWVLIDEIAQRYGPLEFTREEVRGMLEEAHQYGKNDQRCNYPTESDETANYILSRHTEGELESGGEPEATCGDCGRELEEVRPGKHQCTYCEIVRAAARDLEDRLTKRVAAIEKRLLAAGHLKKCEKVRYRSGDIMGINEPKKCTCGRDDIEDIVNELTKATKK